jgi:uncharacterized membrane protein
LHVFIVTFADEHKAAAVLEALRSKDSGEPPRLADAALVVRHPNGRIRVVEDNPHPHAAKWTRRGAVAGALVGLIFPPGMVVSAIAGGVYGGIWARVRDEGLDNFELERIGESLPPGGSAVVAIAEDSLIQEIRPEITEHQNLAHYELSPDAAASLMADGIADYPPD